MVLFGGERAEIDRDLSIFRHPELSVQLPSAGALKLIYIETVGDHEHSLGSQAIGQQRVPHRWGDGYDSSGATPEPNTAERKDHPAGGYQWRAGKDGACSRQGQGVAIVRV